MARKTKTDDTPELVDTDDQAPELLDDAEPEIVKIVPKPRGFAAVYERWPDGTTTRAVVPAAMLDVDELPAEAGALDEVDGGDPEASA